VFSPVQSIIQQQKNARLFAEIMAQKFQIMQVRPRHVKRARGLDTDERLASHKKS
jgi:hypothetical protein